MTYSDNTNMQSNPWISVTMVTYNHEKYIGEAIQSVLDQTFKNFELIIVNDGSTDRTEEIIRQFKDHRIKYLKQINGGLSNARNSGLKQAKGNFIQLLDADDLIQENKISSNLELYLSNSLDSKIIVYSSMRYFEDDQKSTLKILGRDNFIAHVELKQEDASISQKELVFTKNPFVISAPLYPKTMFDEIGCFDETLTALEDWDLHLRCVAQGFKFHHQYQSQGLTLIRLHNSSMMRNPGLLDENFGKVNRKHHLRKLSDVESKKDFIGKIKLIHKLLFK